MITGIMKNDQFEYVKIHDVRIRHLLSFLIKYVQPKSKIGIIGYSIFDLMIRKSLPNCIVYNIIPSKSFAVGEDISPDKILIYDVSKNEISNPDFRFDYIIMTEVLEHLFSNDSLIISNISNLMKNKGFLFFSVPNVSALGKLIHLLIGENPYMSKSEIIDGAFGGFGHIREYSYKEVRNLLSNHFRIIILEGWNDYQNIFNKIAKLLPKVYSETIFAFCQKI